MTSGKIKERRSVLRSLSKMSISEQKREGSNGANEQVTENKRQTR